MSDLATQLVSLIETPLSGAVAEGLHVLASQAEADGDSLTSQILGLLANAFVEKGPEYAKSLAGRLELAAQGDVKAVLEAARDLDPKALTELATRLQSAEAASKAAATEAARIAGAIFALMGKHFLLGLLKGF